MLRLAKRIAPVAAIVAMLAATVTPGLAARPHFGNRFSLLIYTHMQDTEGPIIQKLATAWASTHGGSAKVVVDKGSFQDWATLSKAGRGPDIMFGNPDDNTGTFILGGTVAPVPGGVFDPSQYVSAAGPAVSQGGKVWALPVMLDTYALAYNKKLVPTPPKTFNDLIKIAQKFPNVKGKTYGFMYDVANFYFSYAFFRGFGSYLFKQNGASVDTSDIGLGNAGGVKALTFFRDLVRTYKLFPPDVNYTTAQSLFQKGQLAMFIDGNWDVGANRKALGKNFAVAPLPTLPGGGSPHQFSTVQVAFVNSTSNNKDVSFQLIKDIIPQFQLLDLQTAGRIPVVKSALDSTTLTKDPVLSGYAKAALAAEPLPNVPEMNAVWTPGGNAISLVINGKSQPADAAANLVKGIKQGIAQLTH